jgi:hypothetical protein
MELLDLLHAGTVDKTEARNAFAMESSQVVMTA